MTNYLVGKKKLKSDVGRVEKIAGQGNSAGSHNVFKSFLSLPHSPQLYAPIKQSFEHIQKKILESFPFPIMFSFSTNVLE